MADDWAAFVEKYAVGIVAAIVGAIGAAWLVLEELRHSRKVSARTAERLKLTARPSFAPLEAPASGEVFGVRTAEASGERHAVQEPLRLAPGHAEGKATVVVDATRRFQTHVGIGGSFTESSADLLKQMGQESQQAILEAYFSSERGIGYNAGRVHINSCDFSRGNWACCEEADDMGLKSFSLRRYQDAILPMLKRAAELAATPLRLVASPWSPPAWMKDNGRMQFGGQLKREARGAWAEYYVRFAREMAAEGLPIWAVTVQNEPNATTAWENCRYTAAEERDFVRDHLGPALKGSGLDVRLLVWDHNRDEMWARAREIYADALAAQYIYGVGFHWYGDPRYEAWPDKAGMLCFDNVARVHDLRPDKHLVMTEGCQEGGPHLGEWQLGERYAENIIRDFNNWTEAWIDWNLILDDRGGPNHVGNYCSSPIMVSPKDDHVFFQSSYFYIGHFSRYIKPGAQRVLAGASRDALEVTAFANPDGTVATVVLNRSSEEIPFSLEHAGKSAPTLAPPHSISTFVFLCEESPGSPAEGASG